MIKVNVEVNNKSWKKKIKNPEPIVVNGVSIIPDDAFDIVSDDDEATYWEMKAEVYYGI